MIENFRLKDGESCYEDVVTRKLETVPSVGEAKSVTIVERSSTWQINVRTRKMILVPEIVHSHTITVVGYVITNIQNVGNARKICVYDHKIGCSE